MDEGPCCFVLGEPPPREPGAARFPKTISIPRAPRVPLSPRFQAHRGAGRRGWGPVQHLLSSLGYSPPWRLGCSGLNPHSELPGSPTSAPERQQGPSGLARMSAPPAAPAGHGRSRLGAAAASTAAGSLPASGQRRPRALQSMSHHRPRPGLRLGTSRAGTAVQAPAPAGSRYSSPGRFASAPRSRSPSV